jgi:hypothetical protein
MVQTRGMEVRPGRHIEYDQLEDEATYRVHFWHHTPGLAPNLESYILTGASDVKEAVDWAEMNSSERPWELFVQLEVFRSLGSDPETWWIRLYGTSPLTPDPATDLNSTALSFERITPSE